jgi:hypothetical protein
MTGNNKDIIVVNKNALFEGNTLFYGFRSAESVDYESIILGKTELRPHEEESYLSDFKQLVVCCFIVNKDKGLISAYSNDSLSKKCHDSYVSGSKFSHGYWICSYNYHTKSIDSSVSIDGSVDDGLSNPLLLSGLADLKKEINMDGKFLDAKLLGYINGSSNSSLKDADLTEQERIRRNHFMIVYALNTDAERVVKTGAGSSEMINMFDLRERVLAFKFPPGRSRACAEFDSSTQQSIYALMNYFGKSNPKDKTNL